ncbi:2-succinyl-5-enolpyruvyl-6-hydroxy-3-cyclohexene-1-carboxylic-acid synthase [Enterovibrio nigricans]|uniref:2-succinyl-5-enolpyruvyl-6-hydroxy-3-cyclohexene-1-carboxylate synthase n=1 Tax=Enterovibrio nigricans DSM 22720 TaxID=1121868 RepID=A0A1T4US60_9GAMM|nr:2-succinyl-5-enolpyruvyl-6-hydroxy-3-cyclohexene-1-carboxylic-acid synthase [Enterovibrio nigricans]PKF51023.1 2-succinyl-5-enolpyruvyl-6-hydroxy-3-cyclohexene-1-carboxylic-acid synthase [Enterovibrio nigricans]SKA55552.1 2-succinyl-5-enolpyruvyl-6-hydroxy-3-cyclohexene-1-carboxylate synthase [Enterovibrio nigricans DSM 22720]
MKQFILKQSTLNRVWARLALTCLYRSGVRHICIAPGSRSTPLTLEAEALSQIHADVTLHTHFDERGLGFLALGLAKASEDAVAVIVTSGTAVANLLPAVAETGLTREKLVLLTADRPPELIQNGANQAIQQHNIFGDHVSGALHLPSPTQSLSPAWLLSAIEEKRHQQEQGGGSLHINCPFPEPLYGEMENADAYLSPVSTWLESDTHFLSFTQTVPNLDTALSDWTSLMHQKGVLIVGRTDRKTRIAAGDLAEKLGWPLLCDPQAGQGSDYAGFDVWLQNPACADVLNQAEVILQFGARLVSKRLGQFLGQFNGTYWLIDEHPGRLDPSNRSSLRVVAKGETLANAMLEHSTSAENAHWAVSLYIARSTYFSIIQKQCRAPAALTEKTLATDFANWLAPDSDLFIGNSMAIRLLDMCCSLPDVPVFANRGASGIDGLIATASGVQRARRRRMVCLVGDTSALYDLNSLALLARSTLPLVLIVINNDGGGIFDMLPVPDANKDNYYRMPHGFSFEHAAQMFALNYIAPTDLLEARAACLEAQQHCGTTLMEIRAPAGECGKDLKALFEEITHASLF